LAVSEHELDGSCFHGNAAGLGDVIRHDVDLCIVRAIHRNVRWHARPSPCVSKIIAAIWRGRALGQTTEHVDVCT